MSKGIIVKNKDSKVELMGKIFTSNWYGVWYFSLDFHCKENSKIQKNTKKLTNKSINCVWHLAPAFRFVRGRALVPDRALGGQRKLK